MVESIIHSKIIYIFGIFSATFISYLTPVIIIRKQQLQSWTLLVANRSIGGSKAFQLLSACNCLSAGIFLGICFLDLIPYVEKEFKEIFAIKKVGTHFPLGQFTIIMGVLLVLSLETIIRRFLCYSSPPVLNLEEENSKKVCEEKQDKQELIEVAHDDKETEKFIVEKNVCKHCLADSSDFHLNSINSYLTFSLLIFAKSIHSIFEGLALGLLKDSDVAWHLFLAVLLHECLIGFALGLNSQRNEFEMKTNIKFAIVFSITIPIGIGLGIALGYAPGVLGRTISVVFQALAAGTFLHVTFNELIPSELLSYENSLNTKQKLLKIFLLFIGFCFMALINVLTEDLH